MKKIFFSQLQHLSAVESLSLFPLTETAKIMEHLENAMDVKRLNLALGE